VLGRGDWLIRPKRIAMTMAMAMAISMGRNEL
jgi:hypothetical protein